MRLKRWLVGAAAAVAFALTLAPLGQVQAMPAGAGTASALKSIAGDATTQVRFGGHGGHFGHGGGFGHFHGGGFGHFHGGFYRRHVVFGPRFYHRRFYAGYYPYYGPVYRCPVVWTVYGPRRICGYRRHFVRYHYWRPHRHYYVHRFRHYRWM